MKKLWLFASLVVGSVALGAGSDGFISLFNGKDLTGWRASDKPGTFRVEEGSLVVQGERSHLYYLGPVQNHDFKNFHLRAEIMTFSKANSGVYFQTQWQEKGWPDNGFEVQVNNSHADTKRTGGLYDVKDSYEIPAQDQQWFVLEVIVEGKHVVTKVDGKVIVDYTEPEGAVAPKGHPGRLISHGTFAIQGHDPGGKILYKRIEVKPLP
jgi:hypothetical protein